MTPEEARMWLKASTRPPLIPPYVAQQALATIATMEYETRQDQDGTTHTRLVTPWHTH